MKNLILLTAALFMSVSVFAQKNLDRMSEQKRNAALIKIATNAVKKYAPEYDRGLKVIVTDQYNSFTEDHYRAYHEATDPEDKWQWKWGLKAHTGVKWYAVDFMIDPSKERLVHHTNRAASIFIWADNGKAFQAIFAGRGGGALYNIDEQPDQKEDFHYKPLNRLQMIMEDSVYYDKDGNEI